MRDEPKNGCTGDYRFRSSRGKRRLKICLRLHFLRQTRPQGLSFSLRATRHQLFAQVYYGITTCPEMGRQLTAMLNLSFQNDDSPVLIFTYGYGVISCLRKQHNKIQIPRNSWSHSLRRLSETMDLRPWFSYVDSVYCTWRGQCGDGSLCCSVYTPFTPKVKQV